MTYVKSRSPAGSTVDDRELGQRVKILSDRNPYMAERPDLLYQTASMPYDTETLVSIGSQAYAMQAGNQLAEQLKGLPGASQRAIFGRLSPGQQAALGSMGFAPPNRDEGGLLSDIAHPIGSVVGGITRGASTVLKPVLGPTLEGLNWLANQPGHIYRTTMLQNDQGKAISGIGALIGIGAVLAAPFTAGGSLAAIGALGLGALGGAAAGGMVSSFGGQFDQSAGTNPGDWFRAFNSSWNGERTFRPGAIRRADELLADPRMNGLAQDLAVQGVNVVDLAHEIAGHRGGDRNAQMREIEHLAGTMAAPGSPQFTGAVKSMMNALSDPSFQDAVQALNNGKISIGRDFAGVMGLGQGSTAYNLVSGSTDALFTIAVDPTLMLGYASQAYKAKKYTLAAFEGGSDIVTAYRQVTNLPNVRRSYDMLADAVEHVESGGLQRLRQQAPHLEPLYNDLVTHRRMLIDTGRAIPGEAFNGADAIEYVAGSGKLRPILEGVGSVKNARGLQLVTVSAPKAAFREFRGNVRSFVNGLSDISTDAKMRALAKQNGTNYEEEVLKRVAEIARRSGRDFEDMLPTQLSDLIGEDGLIAKPWLFTNELNPKAYEAGRRVASVRAFGDTNREVGIIGKSIGKVGDALTSMTTMTVGGKTVSLTGRGSAKQIHALAEQGRYMGMSSWERHAWEDIIASSDSPAARYDAIHGWLANMMRTTGIDSTEEGRAMVDKYLTRSRQIYGEGEGGVLVNGHNMDFGMFLSEQADKVVVPNLKEMRKAAVTGGLHRAMGHVDLPIFETAMDKFWQPMVLMRIGFIPRAAGEEWISFMLRGGFGSMTQETAGRFLGRAQVVKGAPETSKLAAVEGVLRKAARERVTGVLDESFTAVERRLAEQGLVAALPAHVRPVARMMQRAEWGDPANVPFARYGRWLEERLSSGLGAKGLAYDQAEQRGVLRQMQAAGQMPLSRPQRAVLNMEGYADSILLGNPDSIRRMLLGGVSDAKVAAGREWSSIHQSMVMRDLSSTTLAEFDPGYDVGSSIHKTNDDTPRWVREVGVRTTLGQTDPRFEGAYLDNVQRSLADPAFRADMLENGFRISAGTGVDEATLGPALDHVFSMGRTGTEAPGELGSSVAGAQARTVLRELVGAQHNPDQWRHMLTELRRTTEGKIIGDTLDLYRKRMEVPTLDSLMGNVFDAISDLKANQFGSLQELQAARQRLTEFGTELNKARPVTEWLDTLPLADRQFAAQFLDGQMLSGNQGFWATHRAQGADAPAKWLYEGLDEARAARVDNLQSKVLDPRYHDAGVTKSLRLPERDQQGQFVNTEFRTASVMLYDAPPLQGIPFEEVLANADNRELVLRNRATIEHILASDSADASLVADYQLAEELHRVDAKMAGIDPTVANKPRMMRQDRSVTDGRVHDLLRPEPATTGKHGPDLWYYPRSGVETHMLPTPDAATNPARQWAEDMVGRGDDLFRRGNRQTVQVKSTIGSDGQPMALVFHYDDLGNLTPVMPGTDYGIGETTQFVDQLGKRIHYGDSNYFTEPLRSTDLTKGQEVMWEMLGPALRDSWADAHGATRVKVKGSKASITLPGRPAQSADMEPLLRASVLDVKRVPLDDLPSHAIGDVVELKNVSAFERFKRFGFDRVIGPSIDAIVRRPMAFHHFSNRFETAMKTLDWTVDPVIMGHVDDLMGEFTGAVHASDFNSQVLGDAAKKIALYHGDRQAARWSTDHSLAWLRSHSEGELNDLLLATATSTAHDTSAVSQAAKGAAFDLQTVDYKTLQAAIGSGTTPVATLDSIAAKLPNGALKDAASIARVDPAVIAADPLLKFIDDRKAWDTIIAANTNLTFQRKSAGEIAAIAAVGDALPFIDSHQFKTQFADWAHGFLPFWYAEENFMKRWARGLADVGPAMIRKAQLGYMGLKQSGIVRTDPSGRDWFVAPGSGLAFDMLSKIPGLERLQGMGIMFQTPTDQMMPGLNNRFGVPSFNPLVTIPMELVTSIMPELQPVERAMRGDFSGQGVVNQVWPAHFRHIVDALWKDENNNQRFANAMISGMQYAEAHHPLPDNATDAQAQDFMDQASNYARIIVISQALGGFIMPGSPSVLISGKSSGMLGLDPGNPGEYLNAEYLTLVRTLGMEEGVSTFLEMHKDATIDDIVNPLAYTVPRTASVSGAPIPSTEEALAFMDQHQGFFHDFPNAGAWLIPQNYSGQDRSQYAFDQQVSDGLRKRRSPQEFFTAMKFKQGANEYFGMRDAFNKEINRLQDAGDSGGADRIRSQMDTTLEIYRVGHPLFASEILNSDGRQRRAKVLDEMRIIVDDPQAPPAPHLEALRTAMHVFDAYKVRLAVLGNDHSTDGRHEIDFLKQQYQGFMESLVASNPAVGSFWSSVLKPESAL